MPTNANQFCSAVSGYILWLILTQPFLSHILPPGIHTDFPNRTWKMQLGFPRWQCPSPSAKDLTYHPRNLSKSISSGLTVTFRRYGMDPGVLTSGLIFATRFSQEQLENLFDAADKDKAGSKGVPRMRKTQHKRTDFDRLYCSHGWEVITN